MRIRPWVLVGGPLLGLLLTVGVLVLHELAPRRWPDAVIRWSPSVDHVMIAALWQARANPAGIDAAWAAGMTRRFLAGALERVAARGGPPALRAGFFLAARVDEPEVAAVLLRRVAAQDPWTCRSLLWVLPSRVESLPVAVALLASGDPDLAADAAHWLSRLDHDTARRVPAAVVDRLVAAVGATPAAGQVVEPEIDLWSDAPLRLRPATPAEADVSARQLRDSAWGALAAVAPARGCAEWRTRRPSGPGFAIAVSQALCATDADGVAWLEALATATPEDHLRALFLRSLEQATFRFGKMGVIDDRRVPAGWFALCRLGAVEPILERCRSTGWVDLIRLLRAAAPEEAAAILATIPAEDRAAFDAALAARSSR